MVSQWSLTQTSTSNPQSVACIDTAGRQMTFSELDDMSNRWAHTLRQLGARRGDHLVLFANNGCPLYSAIWAAQKAGLYYTPIPTPSTEDELERLNKHFPDSLLIADRETATRCAALTATRSPSQRLTLDGPTDGFLDLNELSKDSPTAPLLDEPEGMDLLFSSGTTGEPKGIRFPLPKADGDRLGRIGKIVRDVYHGRTDSIFLSPGPLYHAASLRFSLAFARLGGTVILPARFNPEQTLALIDKHRVTHLAVVPTMISRLMQLPDDILASYDVSSLEAVIHGAAPCPIPLKEKVIDRWGPIIHEYYAGTEGLGFCSIDSKDWLAHKGSVGRTVHGTLEIRDDNDNSLPVGQIGTVHFLGRSQSQYITGRVDDPIVLDRSTTLGDTGYLDDDGFLFLTGRTTDMIISGGVNVYPREIEHVILRAPGVADAAVFAIPDDDMGECVAAAVELAEGADRDTVVSSIGALADHHLARHKRPRHIFAEKELPRTSSGKILVRELRERFTLNSALNVT